MINTIARLLKHHSVGLYISIGLTLACAAHANTLQDSQELGPGILLVATSGMADARFVRSVILIINHSEDGALGLIINKRSEISITSLDPELGALSQEQRFTYFGGPVHIQYMSYLLQERVVPENAQQVLRDIYWDTDLERLKQMLPTTDDDSLRLFFGYAGWGPGQLEFEVSLGHWQVVAARTQDVFSKEVDTLWQRLSKDGPGVITRQGLPYRSASTI